MNWYLLSLKLWFDRRDTRERILIILLCWALIYFLFNFILMNPVGKKIDTYQAANTNLGYQITAWKKQISDLQKLAQSPLYKQWLLHYRSLQKLEGQHKYILNPPAVQQWKDIITTLLKSQQNISLVQIKNFPEEPYVLATAKGGSVETNAPNTPVSSTTKSTNVNQIYQQKLLLVINSNFFDTFNYLKRLEQAIPNIHWDSLKYQVAQYPLARVEMEFSILYDKQP